ncbi:MAG: dihydroneopterin aldolase [candidate division WS1 bacterium]|jgi:dihydroneopterin aldolase|nr:dihydroneopterin aldolase [candidate division WS1 bacterium]
MSRDVIRMTNMSFYGHHGVDDSERELGGRFSLDVELYCDLRAAGRSDSLHDTVDYKAVYELVRQVEAGCNYKLLEALVHDVAQAVLSRFVVDAVTVRARKQSVPLGGLIDHTEIEIHRTRSDLET